MRTSTKWIVGILMGVLVVVIIGVLGWMLFNQFNQSEWVYGSRSGRLWDNTPFNETPRFRIPSQRLPGLMPMHPYNTREGSWTGLFGPLRLLGGTLICLGIPVLLIIGLVILLLRPRNSKSVAVPSPTTQPEVSENDQHPCPSCARQIQPDWKHCPFCGTRL
jgi:hypothetical protein